MTPWPGSRPRPATDAELELVHPEAYVRGIERFCAVRADGHVDADTVVSDRSADLARLASGAGPGRRRAAAGGRGRRRLRGGAPAGPPRHVDPGHGVLPVQPRRRRRRRPSPRAGERVAVVDFDAHHGNGTQDIFYERGDVAVRVLAPAPAVPRQRPAPRRPGRATAPGTTLNIPMPPGRHRRALPPVDRRTWWLRLAGRSRDHLADHVGGLRRPPARPADRPRAHLGRLRRHHRRPGRSWSPPGRRLVFLEGGYDLQAVADSSAATVAALLGERIHPEAPTSGGPGDAAVDRAVHVRDGSTGLSVAFRSAPDRPVASIRDPRPRPRPVRRRPPRGRAVRRRPATACTWSVASCATCSPPTATSWCAPTRTTST